MQGKWAEAKNFESQECKQKQKSSHTGKIRKKKQDKKQLAPRLGLQRASRKSHVSLLIIFSFPQTFYLNFTQL